MLDGDMLELGVSLISNFGPLSGRSSLFAALTAFTVAVFTTSLCDLVRAWKQATACIPNNSSVCSQKIDFVIAWIFTPSILAFVS
jgi:hypothetical protein